MMEQRQLERLGRLFEKVVSDSANNIEKKELKSLYQDYINDGRDKSFGRATTTVYQRA
jgi:hypothetical protein